jgi:hypothetical protein
MEETLVCELRTSLQLPLDDIVEVMRRCVSEKLSRSAIHRCLQRHAISQRKKPVRPSVGIFEQATVGFIHVDLKHLPALERRKSYAFVAIDRATRYVYLEIHRRRDARTSEGFLTRFLAHFPYRVHTILTDNGAEFTDRFAVDMKNKPPGRPSGKYPFDLLCANHNIDHRLTRPYRPQTNGLVERFNRRIAEAIDREPKRGAARRTFLCHADRDAFLGRFVADYNRTRLKCLGYLAPSEALANLPGPNTNAGAQHRGLTTSLRAERSNPFLLSLCGNMDCFASLAMTEDTVSRSRGAMRPEFCISFALQKSEGAGKTGCALHPRSRVHDAQRNAHTSIQVQRRTPGLPCAMALRLIRVRSGDRLSCHHHRQNYFRQLDASTGASGPHDFTVRNDSVRLSPPSRPPLPAPTSATMAYAPLVGQGGGS